jgi:hypothetical protein
MVEFDTAQKRCKNLERPLVEAHKTAVDRWATFVKEQPELALPFDATARANFIHPHIRHEILQRVAGVPGVRPTPENLDLFGLIIDEDLFMRFKFVGHGLPHSYPTDRQKELAEQKFSEDLTELLLGDGSLDPPTLVTCGYTLDGEKLGRLEIRRDCKGHLPWSYDIFGGQAVVSPLIIPGMKDNTKPAKVKSKKRKAAPDTQEETG